MASKRAIVIGGGPAGLMAAEVLADSGVAVDLYDAMPSVGRKFLLAGVGGMNITHSEAMPVFHSRFRDPAGGLRDSLEEFGNEHLRAWIHQLGIETFVGSSGRVFPRQMKAAPLLRAWLHRLRAAGVRIHTRHRWIGINADGEHEFIHRDSRVTASADATVLALGGASWQRLGSDGAWVELLAKYGVDIAELKPSNCGFECEWSAVHRERFAGQPVKNIAMRLAGEQGFRAGECLVTASGLEGSLVYALSAGIRDRIEKDGKAVIEIDLLPDLSHHEVVQKLSRPRGRKSFSEHLRRKLGLDAVKLSLLRESQPDPTGLAVERLAEVLKCLPLELLRTRPIDEAISTAGGVRFSSIDRGLMLASLPGIFCAGEMLDWEAPTGGYLLTACFATGRRAGKAAAAFLESRND